MASTTVSITGRDKQMRVTTIIPLDKLPLDEGEANNVFKSRVSTADSKIEVSADDGTTWRDAIIPPPALSSNAAPDANGANGASGGDGLGRLLRNLRLSKPTKKTRCHRKQNKKSRKQRS